MKFRIKFIFTFVLLIAILSIPSYVFASWNGGPTVYPAGTHGLTVPSPGVHTHSAQNDDGVQDTQQIWYDPNPPVLTSSSQIFTANHITPISISFSDQGLSGVATVELKIKNGSGSTASYSFSNTTVAIIPQHDFGRAGKHDLLWRATDNVGNSSGWKSASNFFHIVANVPEWTSCLANYQTSCPSTITFDSSTRIADNSDYFTGVVKLVDRYGNQVVTESGIKSVKVKFNFSNTNYLDQIARTGDPSRYVSSEFGLDKNPGDDDTGWLAEAVGGNGEYELKVYSYAPTSAGYTPITSAGFDLNFDSIDYQVESSMFGNTVVNAFSSDSSMILAFSPTLISTPTALNWNGSSYVAEASAIENISINVIKRFNVNFGNASSNRGISNLESGLLMETQESVIWGSGLTESPGSAMSLGIDTASPFTGLWNGISTLIASIGAGADADLRISAIPVLAVGSTAPDKFTTLLETYEGYTLDAKHVRHVSERVGSDSTSPDVQNPTIEVIGAVRSSSGTFEKQSGANANQSIGDAVQNELKAGITRNTVWLTGNASVSGCSSDVTINDLNSFISANPSCAHQDGTILFFEGADVTLNLNGGSLPSSVGKTLLVSGGDVHIKGNIAYSGGSDALGMILFQNPSTGAGGNIYVYPNVTEIVGAWYAEGGIISVNSQGLADEDQGSACDGSNGFCDRTYELRNQLHWKGIIATANTIGGSDANPVVCPGGVTCSRDEARKYDLMYLRTYTPDSGGTAAASVTSTAALVVQYDSRIQNDPPPLFEIGSGAQGEQMGGWLLKVIREIWE